MYPKEQIVPDNPRPWPLPSARALIGSVTPAEYPDPRGRPVTPSPQPAVVAGPPAAADEHEVLLSVRIPNGLRRRYRQAALDADRPMKQLVIDALEHFLRDEPAR